MAVIGASSPFARVPAKVPSPNPQRPLTLASRASDVCRPPTSQPVFAEVAAYARARRPMASWIEASVTKVARVSAMFSKSLARHRFSPEPAECARPPCGAAGRPSLHVVAPLYDLQAQQRLPQNYDGYFGRSAGCRTAAPRSAVTGQVAPTQPDCTL
jgi:hypothetical protein